MIEARCVKSNLRLPPDSEEVKGAIAEASDPLSEDLPLGRRRISDGLSHYLMWSAVVLFIRIHLIGILVFEDHFLSQCAFIAAMTCVMAAFLLGV